MNRRTLLVWIMAIAVGLATLPPLTLLFIPDTAVQQAVSRIVAANGFTLLAKNIGTALPFGITATGISVSDATTTLLTFEHASLQLRLLPLLTGRIAIKVSAGSGSSTVAGTVSLLPRLQANLQITNYELSTIPFLSAASGGSVTGLAQVDLNLDSKQNAAADGDARLLVRNLNLKGVRISSMPLPDASFPELRGLLKIKGQTIVIDNLALQGNGIYLRLGGSVPLSAAAPLNLSLELMPSAEFMEQQKSVFLFMALYQASPGHFKLPISGTLTSPQLAGR